MEKYSNIICIKCGGSIHTTEYRPQVTLKSPAITIGEYLLRTCVCCGHKIAQHTLDYKEFTDGKL